MFDYDWNLWVAAEHGACLFVGTARGPDFASACRARALRDRAFSDQFDAGRMTFRGSRLHPSPKPALAEVTSGPARLPRFHLEIVAA